MKDTMRGVSPQDMVEYINQGIAALNFIQDHILTQENIQSVKDVFLKLETFGEQAKDMIEQAVAFVETTMSGRSRSIKQCGLDNKLAKSRTLAVYQAIRAELQPSPIVPKNTAKSDGKGVDD